MGDDNYVKELKQGAVGTKLPTMLDLAPRSENNFSGRLETPTARNYLVTDEDTGKQVVRKEKTPQEVASEIAVRIRTLHYEGRRLDEIYEILESEGYEYSAIEPVFMDYLNKIRPAAKSQAPQAQARSGQVTAAPRAPVPTPAQMATRGSVPLQRQVSAPAQNTSMNQNAYTNQNQTGPKSNLEIVELNAVNPRAIPAREEVPTNIPKEYPGPRPMQDSAEDIGGITGTLGGSDFAPLFVKVGKYRESLEDLNDLENYLRAMSRLFEIVEELEKVRVMNIEALDKIHKKALATASKLSSGLLKPKGMSIEGTRESDVELNKLGDVIGDLSKELTMLKKEVDKLNRLE